jgi:sec-independent protein translocase protein TatA
MLEGIFQPMHLLVILFIALMVFGPKKLPELGRGLGDGIRSFKDSMRDEKRDEASKTSVEKRDAAGEELTATDIASLTGRG